MEIKRGGQRVGAGRKPIAEKKVPITVYVKGGKVLEFGSIEKTKEGIYDYLENAPNNEPTNELIDLTKPTNVVKPFEQPKSNYFINTEIKKEDIILSEFESFKVEILKTETIQEVEAVMKRVKGALMFAKQKINLEQIAKEHSKPFYND